MLSSSLPSDLFRSSLLSNIKVGLLLTAAAATAATAAAAAAAVRLLIADMATADTPRNERTVGGAAADRGAASTGGTNPRLSTIHRMQRRQRQRAEGVKLSVPVAFSKHLNPEDAAFLLAEVRRRNESCVILRFGL